MIASTSPLEILAAFAIAFVAGILSTLALTRHIQNIRKEMQPRPPPAA